MAFGPDKFPSQQSVVTNMSAGIYERHPRLEERRYRARSLVLILARASNMVRNIVILVPILQFEALIVDRSRLL